MAQLDKAKKIAKLFSLIPSLTDTKAGIWQITQRTKTD